MSIVRFACVAVCLGFVSSVARADDLFLAAGSDFPGRIWLSEGGTVERVLHARHARADRAFPNAIMKVAQVAVTPDDKIFYCSGLDGYVMHLLDGRHEILSFEFDGQIRDLACTAEERTVYFSVVPTPQNGAPLADGKIYRRDLGDGRPTVVATIRQADIGGNWWGTFTIRDGAIYIATLEDNGRIFKVDDNTVSPIFEAHAARIQGLTAGGDGFFHFVTGAGKVFRTTDFQSVEPVLTTSRRLTDVTVRAPADSIRP